MNVEYQLNVWFVKVKHQTRVKNTGNLGHEHACKADVFVTIWDEFKILSDAGWILVMKETAQEETKLL